MHQVFGVAAGSEFYLYYPGRVALVLFKRFFVLQYICGIIALLHLFAEKLYLGRALPRLGMALVIGIFSLALIGGVWLQPRMENFNQTRYAGVNPEERERARHSFGLWHGVSQFANLVIIGGLLFHLIRVTRPGESDRYTTFTIFRS